MFLIRITRNHIGIEKHPETLVHFYIYFLQNSQNQIHFTLFKYWFTLSFENTNSLRIDNPSQNGSCSISLERPRCLLSNDINFAQIGVRTEKLWLPEVGVSELFFRVFPVKISAKRGKLPANRELRLVAGVAVFLTHPGSRINSQRAGRNSRKYRLLLNVIRKSILALGYAFSFGNVITIVFRFVALSLLVDWIFPLLALHV